MSGTADTSTPADRQKFANHLEGGLGGPALLQLAAVVENSPAPMPETSAYLLGFEAGATFAQGVARIRQRIADGHAPY